MDNLTTVDNQDERNMMYLYQYLLKRHDWHWRASDDSRFLDRNIERERQIDKLRELIDPSNILYNQFSPFKK